jgi:hypothetical protein
MFVVRWAAALTALLDLWLWGIVAGAAAAVVLAGAVGAGALPPSALPSTDTAVRLATDSQGTWAAIVASVASVASTSLPGPRVCRVVLGFGTLEALVGRSTTGDCLEDEHFDPNWGVAAQATTGGLFAFRRADGTLAFTDGHRTWLLGRAGLQRRLNTQRLCWEPDAEPRTCLSN